MLTSDPVRRFRKLGVATADGNALISAGAGNLLALILTVGATARYYKVYDKATAPSSTSTPIMTIYVPAGGTVVVNLAEVGLPFSLGLGIRASALGPDADTTYTSFAAGDSSVTALYQLN